MKENITAVISDLPFTVILLTEHKPSCAVLNVTLQNGCRLNQSCSHDMHYYQILKYVKKKQSSRKEVPQ
jgi:hypothetical protein